jgi:hypothetical protein
LLVTGIVVGILMAYFYHDIGGKTVWPLIEQSFIVIVAAVIGALVAIGIFLVAIMKS